MSGKIGGTCHSRVSLVKKGFGHLGTMLDPKYCGQLLIMLNNTTDSDLDLEVGERLVSLVFYYLSTPIRNPVLATPPSHSNKVATMDRDGIYGKWCNDNQWANNPKNLKEIFVEECSKEIEKMKETNVQSKSFLKRIWKSSRGRIAIKYAVIAIIIAIAFWIVSRWFPPADKSGWAGIVLPTVICLITIIAGDFQRNKEK